MMLRYEDQLIKIKQTIISSECLRGANGELNIAILKEWHWLNAVDKCMASHPGE